MGSRRRAVRRIITRAIVFLLLGAMVNVAVAWGCAIWSPLDFGKEVEATDHETERWRSLADSASMPPPPWWGRPQPGREMIRVTRDRGCGYNVHALKSVALRGSVREHWAMRSLTTVCAGWPCSALTGARWDAEAGVDHYASKSLIGTSMQSLPPVHEEMNLIGIIRPRPLGGPSFRALPCFTLWPGFAINTLFYTAILWGVWSLFAAPFALRRRRRIKRGLCPVCAYPIGDSPVCTECGHTLRVEDALTSSQR